MLSIRNKLYNETLVVTDLKIQDNTTPAYYLIIDSDSDGSVYTADRTLTIDTVNTSPTLEIAANLTIEATSIINQDLSTDATGVEFADITLDNGLVVNDDGTTGEVGINFISINSTFSTIAQSDAENIASSSDLRIGLDETLRTLIICDRGDIGTDFGLSATSDPTLYIFNAAGSEYLRISNESIYSVDNLTITVLDNFITSADKYIFQLHRDVTFGNVFTFDSLANLELDDTDGQQAWMYLEPKVLQTSTAAFDGLYLNVDTTNLTYGDGTTGDGNNLLRLAVGGTTKFKIDTDGAITAPSITISEKIIETVNAHGSVSSGTEDFDLNDGTYHTVTATGDFTVTISNFPASGKVSSIVFKLINAGAHTITWPGVVDWPGGVEPSWTSSGTDFALFFTDDGGTIVYGTRSIQDSK